MPGIIGRTKPTIDPRKPVSVNVDQSSLVKKICIVAPLIIKLCSIYGKYQKIANRMIAV
jgi:hypothetical protein